MTTLPICFITFFAVTFVLAIWMVFSPLSDMTMAVVGEASSSSPSDAFDGDVTDNNEPDSYQDFLSHAEACVRTEFDSKDTLIEQILWLNGGQMTNVRPEIIVDHMVRARLVRLIDGIWTVASHIDLHDYSRNFIMSIDDYEWSQLKLKNELAEQLKI